MHNKNNRLNCWLQAEIEFSNDPYFDIRVSCPAKSIIKSLPSKPWKLKPDKVVKIVKIKYIKRRAYFIWKKNERKRRRWIKERAYFLSLKIPTNSAYANWCQAAHEYDNLRTKQ